MDSVTNHKINIISQNKTWLFVPATRIDRVAKAFASDADAVILDLEDAVAPEDKADARKALQQYHDSVDYQSIWVRINKAGSEEFFKDIVLCQKMPNLAGVLLAKAEQVADIESVHQLINLPVIALIESAVGLYQVDNMAKAVGLAAFSYGFRFMQWFARASRYACCWYRRQSDSLSVGLTSKVHELAAPIDTVYPDFNDEIGLSARVSLWSQMGMSGMLCIHPKQVAVVQHALKPTESELSFAKRVIEEYERSGQAVFEIDGQMVDAPVIERSLQLLD